ncbi:F-box/LRR-repeat protein At3g48880 isoform X1 [Rosa chinensis]|uniref:F-box/LRR-repeat protein At3g48880 isoform X1 n=2 Tax=Rosa chinensis TaxID=74649 RepID=UPI000D088986|nr:F-box/LRR-repeat protein At3g48880 isoform X1 [Rosa chinensis]XP_040368513.1 F-box/LRR-repeat protein At3g48880 isoform X1 [Rosa chinensis]XP_040368514.1 F-box/LRR-repeat protein At3g48880 isoform X1 [Rosa chinensis]XP_040368515.1 F-box/LRR-repeat protein At3g48880 isoform X1 [Rosa chinensis]
MSSSGNPPQQLSRSRIMFIDHFAPRPNPTLEYWHLNPTPRSRHDRKWEDLESDCLVNIFQRVGMESMLMFIPFVCKSWHKASRTPAVWKSLIFPEGIFDPMNFDTDTGENEGYWFDLFLRKFAREFDIPWSNFTVPKFVNLAINRSEGGAEFLKLPGLICSVYMYAMKQILNHIKDNNCSNFKGLHMADAYITCKDASAMVRCVPELRYLCFRRATLSKKSLLKILRVCRDLEVLDVRGCTGFDEDDEEILELASHIPKFMCAGSHLQPDFVSGRIILPYDDEDDEEEHKEEGQQENRGQGQQEG